MDALDLRILRTMGILSHGPLPKDPDALKPGRIARTLGITRETARERIARMEIAGVIQGYQVYPNLHHFGLDAAGFLFAVQDEEAQARLAKHVEAVEGVLEVLYFLGREVCIDVCYRSPGDLERKLRLLASFTGDSSPRRFWAREMPPVTRSLTNLDWRILKTLRGRARRPLVEVAGEVGVGYRTVKRHHDRMAREGSFFSVPVLNFGKFGGLLPFGLLFYLQTGRGKETFAAIMRAFDDRLLFTALPGSPEFGNFDIVAFVESPEQVEKMRELALSIPGVERATALVYRGLTEHTAWIDDAIEMKIRGTESRGPGR